MTTPDAPREITIEEINTIYAHLAGDRMDGVPFRGVTLEQVEAVCNLARRALSQAGGERLASVMQNGFMTCNSGGGKNPYISIEFRTLDEAYALYDFLLGRPSPSVSVEGEREGCLHKTASHQEDETFVCDNCGAQVVFVKGLWWTEHAKADTPQSVPTNPRESAEYLKIRDAQDYHNKRRLTPDDTRRQGHSKLVYNKETSTIDKVDPHPAIDTDLRLIIERDRSNVAKGVSGIKKAISAYRWLIDGGRGSYAWDDDKWRDEFGRAVNEIEDALAPLAKIAADLSNSPTDSAEVHAARTPDAPLSQGEELMKWLREAMLPDQSGERLPQTAKYREIIDCIASLVAERDKWKMFFEDRDRRLATLSENHRNVCAELAQLVEKVSVLEAALAKYGGHVGECHFPWRNDAQCTCGLNAALGLVPVSDEAERELKDGGR